MLAAAFSRHRLGLRPHVKVVATFLLRVMNQANPATYWQQGAQHEGDVPAQWLERLRGAQTRDLAVAAKKD
eukprot:9143279-Heterocapsa_arctica.AAC.1